MGHTDLFHCNDQNRCKQFLEKGQMIYSTEDGHWLGSGMYFWDNLANALFWKREKDRKESGNRHVIIQSCASLERCLDLTNDTVLDTIYKFWDKLSGRIENRDEEEKKHLGLILNYLFDNKIFDDYSLKDDYNIIKTIGEYGREEHILLYNNSRKLPKPTNKHRIIYNVKNAECILFSREVENYENG